MSAPPARLSFWLRQSLAWSQVTVRRERDSASWDRSALASQRLALLKLDAIGDFVLATALLRYLERRLPAADITLICRQPVGALARDQFPAWRVLELPPRSKPLRDIFLQRQVKRALLQERPFDLALDLRARRDMGDSVTASWVPARFKVALANQYHLAAVELRGEDRIYDVLLPEPAPQVEVALDILNHRQMARFLFPDDADTELLLPHLKPPIQHGEAVARVLKPHGLEINQAFLLVCPGSMVPIKEYPPRRLASAVASALKEYPQLPIVVAGSENDRRTTEPFAEALANRMKVVNLTGQLSLVQHTLLVALATAVLAMDSASAHIAGALGRPAVVLLGGGHPGVFAPWGPPERIRWLRNPLPCYGCNWLCCHAVPHCIHDIPESRIAQELADLLDRFRGQSQGPGDVSTGR